MHSRSPATRKYWMVGTTEDLKIIILDCERQAWLLSSDKNIRRCKTFNKSNILDRLENTSTGDASGQRLENKNIVIWGKVIENTVICGT